MAVSFRVTGTWAELTADGAVAIPATPQAGDRMYLFARWKDFSITAQVTSPVGWTKLTEFADGSTSTGNGTGSVKVACWYRDWQSGDTNPTVDFSANPTNASVVIMVMSKAGGDVWLTPLAVTAAMTNWTTTSQIVSASSTVAVPSGGVVMGLIGIRDDTATMTRPTSGIDDSTSAITWNGNYVESPASHHSTTTGDDGAADLGYRLVTTGATATLRMTGTLSAAETGAGLWVVQGSATADPKAPIPGALALSTTAFAPKLAATVTPGTKSLSLTAFAPRAQLGTKVVPAKLSLSLTSFAPKLTFAVNVPVRSLALTQFIPLVIRGVTVPTASLSLAGFAPVIGLSVTPPSIGLGIASVEPEILIRPTFFFPDTAELTLSTFEPAVVNTTPAYRTSTAAASTFATLNPSVSITGEVGDLLVVFAFVSGNTNDTPTCVDSDGSYELIGVAAVNIGGVDYRLSAFVRSALIETGGISYSLAVLTGSNTSRSAHVYAISGLSRAGLAAIRSKGGESNQSAGTPAPTLDQSALTGNVTLVAVGSTDTTTEPPTDWIERHDSSTTSPALALESASRDFGFTGTTITYGAAQDTEFCSFAIELDSTVAEVVTPDTQALTLTPFVSALHETTTPSTLSLSVSTFVPSIALTANVVVSPAATSLPTSQSAPVLAATVTPSTKALSLSTFAPSTITAARVVPSTLSLTTSTFRPTLAETLTPSTRGLTLTTFAATAATSANVTLIPATASLTTNPFIPVLTETTTPSTQAFSLTAFAPATVATNNVRVTPSTVSLSLSTLVPRLARTITPITKTLTLATFAPTLTASITIVPTPTVLAATRFAPVLAGTILVTTRTLTLSTLAPSVVGGQRVVPDAMSLALISFAPVLQSGTRVIPTTKALTLAKFAPVPSSAITSATSTLTITTFTPTVTVSTGSEFTPITATLALTTYAPLLSLSVIPPSVTITVTGFAPLVRTAGRPHPRRTHVVQSLNYTADVGLINREYVVSDPDHETEYG